MDGTHEKAVEKWVGEWLDTILRGMRARGEIPDDVGVLVTIQVAGREIEVDGYDSVLCGGGEGEGVLERPRRRRIDVRVGDVSYGLPPSD